MTCLNYMPDCPMCGRRLLYPDQPRFDVRGGPGYERRVIVDVACERCPALVTVDDREDVESVGWRSVVCFIPNAPIKVRNVR